MTPSGGGRARTRPDNLPKRPAEEPHAIQRRARPRIRDAQRGQVLRDGQGSEGGRAGRTLQILAALNLLLGHVSLEAGGGVQMRRRIEGLFD